MARGLYANLGVPRGQTLVDEVGKSAVHIVTITGEPGGLWDQSSLAAAVLIAGGVDVYQRNLEAFEDRSLHHEPGLVHESAELGEQRVVVEVGVVLRRRSTPWSRTARTTWYAPSEPALPP